jgi:hypothetical protein
MGFCLLAAGGTPLAAQGITSAALQGRVTSAAGEPVAAARVIVTHTESGNHWIATAAASGRYLLESLPIGSYRVEVRAVGFAPAARSGIQLTLGQRVLADFALQPVAARLGELTVVATRSGNNGPAHSVSDSLLGRLPILNRDVLSLVRESPLATQNVFGTSIAGQNPRHNSYQIDGGENNSLYGQFASTPGSFINLFSAPGGGGLRTIALDAVEELVVLAAPFDVRYGGFSGGLINAVTKSGGNSVHGSAFGALQNWRLVGRDLEAERLSHFTTEQFGASVGGPIVRDRLQYFAAADLQESGLPYTGALIGSDTTQGRDSVGVGVRRASALRFQEILRRNYRVEPGSFGPPSPSNPAQSLFGKLTWQTGTSGRIELSQSYVQGRVESPLLTRVADSVYELGSADLRFRSKTLATRLSWKALFAGRVSQEFTLAYLRIRDLCEPVAVFAQVRVPADRSELVAGSNPLCPGRAVQQRVLELTDNLAFLLGEHHLTLGTHGEILRFRDPTTTFNSVGLWIFDSLDSLELALPALYMRSLPGLLRTEGTVADFRVHQLGAYLQDQWSPSARFELTLGIRLDAPLFPDRPPTNPELLAALGVNTGRSPRGAMLWSPRAGVRYTIAGDVPLTLRGGVGIFSGRPAYVFPADAYRSTGLEQFFLFCAGVDAPAVTLDPAAQPAACRAGLPIGAPRVAFFDPGYRFPQELKLAIGLERPLPGHWLGSLDLLLSKGINQPYFRDVNLAPAGAVLSGEAGRVLYGTLQNGDPQPQRVSSSYTSVVELTHRAGGRSLIASVQLSRPLTRGTGFQAAYTFSDVRDLMLNGGGLGYSLSGYGLAADQISSTVVDGTLEHRNLRPSAIEVRHKLRLTATADLPLAIQIAGIYEASSGTPFTYVVNGDINADGFGPTLFGQQSDDPVYVPRASAPGGDLTLLSENGPASAAEYQRLETFIRSEPCLRNSRGTLLRRNRCRNHWTGLLDLRLSKLLRTGGGQKLSLSVDLFNALHLLDRDWGLIRRTADFGVEEVPLIRLVGYDAGNDRGSYQLDLPSRHHVDLDASRWRVQLGVRYGF